MDLEKSYNGKKKMERKYLLFKQKGQRNIIFPELNTGFCFLFDFWDHNNKHIEQQ